jgi:mono/diheme cytochrome c family protein
MNNHVPALSRSVGLAFAALCSAYIGAASAVAQPPERPAVPAAVARGAAIYSEHCAVCHGRRGKGNGPAASALTPRPTDLTSLKSPAGTFPSAHLAAVLRGTDPVLAHGSSTMMVWGTLFLADANGDRAAADARVGDLVQYIASIQKPR